ncbi:Hypothetical predicted protein [Marmota monax]|uniref:Uncharacterized protein n=1 Tax=Marmota monax TaxID=9995 RepID=A0A5E4AJU2_MARMO|nr:hypothetical protein GHT09_018818 [Marmota monax]VTJ56742.1 Hypothetical predicted protein [Marmota monax]
MCVCMDHAAGPACCCPGVKQQVQESWLQSGLCFLGELGRDRVSARSSWRIHPREQPPMCRMRVPEHKVKTPPASSVTRVTVLSTCHVHLAHRCGKCRRWLETLPSLGA